MGLKTFVKVSNITNLSDARYCAGMMVDVLGFNLEPSSSHKVSPGDYKEMTEWVSGVRFCGELGHASIDEIKQAMKTYDLDLIQIETLDLVEKVQLSGKEIIFKINIEKKDDLKKLKSTLSYLDELVSYAIIKCKDPSLTESLDTFIGYYGGNVQLLKGYDISAQPELSRFPGIELEATEEERPGYKDYGEVMDVLEVLESDD